MPDDTNPYGLTFPYPINGPTRRPRGDGCTSCVHKTYCPAVYFWRLHSGNFFEFDAGQGTKCASWSNQVADMVVTVSDADLNYAEYRFLQGIETEPDRCNLDTTTGNSRM